MIRSSDGGFGARSLPADAGKPEPPERPVDRGERPSVQDQVHPGESLPVGGRGVLGPFAGAVLAECGVEGLVVVHLGQQPQVDEALVRRDSFVERHEECVAPALCDLQRRNELGGPARPAGTDVDHRDRAETCQQDGDLLAERAPLIPADEHLPDGGPLPRLSLEPDGIAGDAEDEGADV